MNTQVDPNAIPHDAMHPDLPLTAALRADLTNSIWTRLVSGWGDVEGLVADVAAEYELSEQQCTAVVVALRDARLRQQKELGDYRCRTLAAFDEINAAGVVARADFTCCNTCASSDILHEADDSRRWLGYIFFHGQDTERLIDTGQTYIGFGAFPPDDFDEDAWARLSVQERKDMYRASVTTMFDEAVFPILRRHGIEPVWGRDVDERVLLTNADWYAPIAG